MMIISKPIGFLFLFLGVLLVMPGQARAQAATAFATDTLTIEATTARHDFTVELALSPAQRSRGLMFRQSMAADRGMLFLYPHDQVIGMWMKNTFIPLDMLFIDRTGRVVAVHEGAVPHSLATISSGVPARAVLELAAGTVKRLGLDIGNRVLYPAFSGG